MAALSGSEILQALCALRETGRVLYVAAHPDDENTRLITYFARARGFACAYLSLTRGDGGQNLIGSELGDGLGAIRTQELLAARRLDGGQQFFTRAVDYGFSKDYREALRVWDRVAVLADTVRVMRMFRPDVVITRFSPEPSDTHGHHTASTVIALEAFAQAGDAHAFPDQLGRLAACSARRIVWNIFQWPGRPVTIPPEAVQVDLGAYLPLLGRSVGEIAAASRGMHKSQGMGAIATRGTTPEWFVTLAGEPMQRDPFDGVDTTWARFTGGAAIGREIDALVEAFDARAPDRSVPGLLSVRTKVREIETSFRASPDARVVREKAIAVDRVLAACLGLYVESVVPTAEVVHGEALPLKHVALARGAFPVRWRSVRDAHGAALAEALAGEGSLSANVPLTLASSPVLPHDAAVTQPYWLAEPGTPGTFTVRDPELIGLPEAPPAYPLTWAFEVGGQTLEIPDEPVHVVGDPVRGELRHRLRVIPPVSVDFAGPLELFAPRATRRVEVELVAARAGLAGTVRLDAPAGWRVAPEQQEVALGAPGERMRVAFDVTAPAVPEVTRITCAMQIGAATHGRRRVNIRYDHVPVQVLQPPAALKAVCLELAVRGRSVGYLPGAGDEVGAALERMGYAVTELDDADLTAAGLSGLDAVVLGIRAYNTRSGLAARLADLFAYVAGGGTVVVQYNTAHALHVPRAAPFPLTLSRDRVTDEASAVTVLAPDHPAITGPNPIGPADFAGWVQERGLYFPAQWDAAFTPLLAMADPGEPPRQGALLAARHGRGWFVYTGLSFFRQLPAGVPGAYRLFANLVSLGAS